MRTRNPRSSRAADTILGRTSPGRAGSRGITIRDGTTEAHPVLDLTVVGGTVTDNDDGTAVLTIGGTPGASGAIGGPHEVYAKEDGGLVGDGVTNDTTALQSLINSCTLNGTQSCTIRFEPGTYLISGALQDTGAFNGQILLPNNAAGTDLITLTLEGPARPAWGGDYTTDGGMAIIRSTLTGGSGTAACISGGNGITNRISVVIRDLRFRAPSNPTFTMLNLSSTFEGMRDGVLIAAANPIVQPTNTSTYGIRLPRKDIGSKSLEDIWVLGFYTGIQVAELSTGHLNAWLCMIGVELGISSHQSGPFRIETLSCPVSIKPSGVTYCDIWYDGEHGAAPYSDAWSFTTYDLDDPNNYLYGHIRWWGVTQGTGADHLFTVNGGTNAAYEEMGALPNAGKINGVAITGTPAAGYVPVAASGTAATWRAPAATGTTPMITDTPSTPFVFADILQNEAGNEWLFADA